ncbi:MAG: IS110 family transposase [Acidimicrobiales bacterium]
MSSLEQREGLVHIAFDMSKDLLVAGVLRSGEEAPAIERIFNDEPSVRRFVRGFSDRGALRTCYEAGPGGYELHRLLASMKVPCEVIAPALIPTAPGDRVKTDTRDARRLVRQFRAGELVAIRVPTRAEEAVRDLCRARGDAVEDLTRAKNRLGHFLLRHGHVWRDGSTWTLKHRSWLGTRTFEEPAARSTFSRYKATVECREAELEGIEADLAMFFDADPFCGPLRRLSAYRGVDHLGGLVLQAEVCDWRRFSGRPDAGAFCGLVPSEYSSGASVRRGSITRAGNVHLRHQLVESAWAYRSGPSLGTGLRRRQEGVPADTVARAWAAQVDLCRRFRSLDARKSVRGVVVTAIARRLVGHLYDEMVAA